jgi:hypothetical protein
MTMTNTQQSTCSERLLVSERRTSAPTLASRVAQSVRSPNLPHCRTRASFGNVFAVLFRRKSISTTRLLGVDAVRGKLTIERPTGMSEMQNPYSIFCGQRAVSGESGPLEQRLVSFG